MADTQVEVEVEVLHTHPIVRQHQQMPDTHAPGLAAPSASSHKRTPSLDADDDDDTYSTPPTTPMVPSPASSQTSYGVHEPSSTATPSAQSQSQTQANRLSRRASQLQLQLQLDKSNAQDWTRGVEVEAASPEIVMHREGADKRKIENGYAKPSAAAVAAGLDSAFDAGSSQGPKDMTVGTAS